MYGTQFAYVFTLKPLQDDRRETELFKVLEEDGITVLLVTHTFRELQIMIDLPPPNYIARIRRHAAVILSCSSVGLG